MLLVFLYHFTWRHMLHVADRPRAYLMQVKKRISTQLNSAARLVSSDKLPLVFSISLCFTSVIFEEHLVMPDQCPYNE